MTTVTSSLSGVPLINRSLNLVIGFPNDPSLDVKVPFNAGNASGLDISGFDVSFRVEKSLKASEPNTCSLQVYNLNPDSRQRLGGQHSLFVRLEAGYKARTAQIFFGEVHAAWTVRDGSDFITYLESSDTIARPTGVHRTSKAQPGAVGNVTKTFGAYVPIKQAFDAIVAQMGVGRGNLDAALQGAVQIPVNSAAVIGNSAQRMTDLCRSAGLEWSIQDGALQLLNIGKALQTSDAIRVSVETGMVGSPSVDSQGAVSAKTLLIPGLVPGCLVVIDSLFVRQGGYRVEKCRYLGSTFGPEWYCEFDAVKY